ncbi:MAG: branched-chain amino acid ABC transporter permease [Thermodesulfobacteriota bacterium]|nr:branched-chain amino acid ABC transporter permease [Thermodesulfobacteriota bacterium]
MLSQLSQVIASGLAIGSCYALIALAMVIIYKTSEVLNFAQGEMAMVSTFIAYTLLTTYDIPFIIAFPLTLLFSLILGMIIEFLFLRPAKDPTVLGLIVITLGAEMILYGIAGWKWGAETKSFPSPILDTKVYNIKGIVISQLNIWVFVVCIGLMLLLFLFFRFSTLGVAMKATAQNHMAARLMGIRAKRILSFTWGLSALIGAVAGVLIAPITLLDPNMMVDPLLKAFASAVLGGMTSMPGAAVGGGILGVVENLFGWYVSTEFKSVVAFAIIVIVLCVRPSGLLARHYVKKV